MLLGSRVMVGYIFVVVVITFEIRTRALGTIDRPPPEQLVAPMALMKESSPCASKMTCPEAETSVSV